MRWQKLAVLGVLVLPLVSVLLGHEVVSSGQSISGSAVAVLRAIAVDPRDGSLIKATPQGLFSSSDGGRRWKPLPVPASLAQSGVGQVVINPEKPTVIYATGLGTGVILSEDGGATWRRITAGFPSTDIETLAIHAFRRDTLFASIRGRGVYRTENGGQQWQRMDGGPATKPVLALAHSPLSGSMNTGWLYAGTPQGPYISMDCF
jgi:photosystem II stability/assembly factor-like uncharacterized protein